MYVLCDVIFLYFFFFKQETAYEMRISDWSSYVCSSDLHNMVRHRRRGIVEGLQRRLIRRAQFIIARDIGFRAFATRVLLELLEITRAHMRGLIGRLIAARQVGQAIVVVEFGHLGPGRAVERDIETGAIAARRGR